MTWFEELESSLLENGLRSISDDRILWLKNRQDCYIFLWSEIWRERNWLQKFTGNCILISKYCLFTQKSFAKGFWKLASF